MNDMSRATAAQVVRDVALVAPDRADAVAACREAVIRQAQARGEELVEIVVSTILAELPEYREGRSRAELDDIRSGVRGSVGLCLEAVAQGRQLTPDELVALRLTGAQRARQGLPRAVLLESVKVATRSGRAFLMTCGDLSLDSEVLLGAHSEIGAWIDRFEDDATVALGEGHDEEYDRVLSAADRGEALLVDRLLERRFTDEDEVLAHAAEVGLLVGREATVVVLATPGAIDERRLRAAVAELRPRIRLAAGPLRQAPRPHLPVVLQPASVDDWRKWPAKLEQLGAERGVVFVYAERVNCLTETATLYRPIQRSLHCLPAATMSPGAVPSLLPRFHRTMSEGSAWERAEIVREVLGPLDRLPAREAAEALEALDTLYETGASVVGLARHLHLHKNTVGNRLRRVGKLTGLDLRRPAERLVLETALRHRWLVDSR
jgi:hypothetical protein